MLKAGLSPLMFTGLEALQAAMPELIELLSCWRDHEGIDNGTPADVCYCRRDEIGKRRKEQKHATLEA